MDLLLDETTNDMVFVNGSCPVTVGVQQSCQQRLKIMLQTFQGEWFLDTDIGIPYYQTIFGKITSKSSIDVIFQRAILGDKDVIELLYFSSTFSASERRYSLEFRVRTVEGTSEPIEITI